MAQQPQDMPGDVAAAAAALTSDENANDRVNGSGGSKPQYDPQVVEYARRQGWKDESEYKGDPSEWVPPDVFAQRAKEINPILRSRNAAQDRAIKERDDKIAALEQGMESFKKFVEERSKREFDTRLQQLRSQRAEAITNSEGEKVNAIDAEIDKLRSEHPAPTPETTRKALEVRADVREAAEAFAARYSWYGSDRRKTAVANAIAEEVADEMPHLKNTPQFFSELDRRVKAEYGNGDARGSIVETGGNAPVRGGKKTFTNLTAEERDACDRMVRQGIFKDRQEYVDEYFREAQS